MGRLKPKLADGSVFPVLVCTGILLTAGKMVDFPRVYTKFGLLVGRVFW